ncbi:MAG: hypothetical protein ACHP78_07410, partial [Terriglobales bacterium]
REGTPLTALAGRSRGQIPSRNWVRLSESPVVGHPLPQKQCLFRVSLALVGLREKKTEVARTQLKELVAEFPENPLFGSELAKLNVPPAAAIPPQ